MSNMKTFTELLAEFTASQTKTHALGVSCAKLAYECFQGTGNLTYASHFYAALKTNGDKNSFMSWICDFSPAKMEEGGKFLKDKAREIAEGDACWRKGEAFAKPFYSYKQAKLKETSFDAAMLVTQVQRVVSRFQAEGMTPDNDEAGKALVELSNVVTLFAAKVDSTKDNTLEAVDAEFAQHLLKAKDAESLSVPATEEPAAASASA